MENRSLILLGILISQSQHGYQINEFIEKNLGMVTDMKKATAYVILDKLSNSGYIDVTVEQDGNRPPRKVYSINSKGHAYFLDLLRANLAEADKIRYPGDVGIMFLGHLPKEEARELLVQRMQKVEKSIEELSLTPKHKDHAIDLAIDHSIHMLKVDLAWLNNVINRLNIDK